MSSTYVSRINQLDAEQLDNEIYKILSSKSHDISRQLTPGITDKWTPEINALLRTVIWIFSLGTSKSTFGQNLLDLTYINLTKKKAIMFLILSVIPKYMEDKYLDPNRLLITNNDKIIQKFIEKFKILSSLLSFINLLIFLNHGIQPSLIERIIGVSSKTVTNLKPRTIGYSYMTRELLWHSLMEIFTTGLPMINYHQLKYKFKKIFSTTHKHLGVVDNKIDKLTNNTICPECNETPILPHHAGCQHIYCYYCIMSNFTATNCFNCPDCQVELHLADMKIYSMN
ncbi:peroxisome biogenesis factor 2 [Aphidius gifuensis]|uniref:peroxisome biogenesis factor 2 n=1 Tax=Aphidius gifuensis TaxID=684658 RepID=UPI001CDC28A9|nr:peroxisome biogenesis factor 2 [Aphidius gifuensis]